MFLVYVDDSSNADYCVMGAAIIREADFSTIEGWLGAVILQFVPEDQRGTFEFHGSELIAGKEPFHKIERDTRLQIVSRVADVMNGDQGHYFVYGAVDLRALSKSRYAFAQPETIAFDICLEGLYEWFKKQESGEMGLLICDEMKSDLKNRLQQGYRKRRGKSNPYGRRRTELADYIHDDMYFGSSSHSMGLQVADICSNLVLRHLRGDDLTAPMYRTIEPHIFFGRVDAPT